MLKINDTLKRLIRSSNQSNVRNKTELELVKVRLNRFGTLDALTLCCFADSGSDSVAGLTGQYEDFEGDVASGAADLNSSVEEINKQH
jgi:hypothetical protein